MKDQAETWVTEVTVKCDLERITIWNPNSRVSLDYFKEIAQ